MLILRILSMLGLGVMVGGIIGAIVAGDWRYTIAWTVGMAVAILGLIGAGLTWANRTSAAKTAGKDAPRPPARDARRRGLRIAVAIAAIVVPAVATLVPAFGSLARIGTNQSMLTGAYQPEAMAAIAGVVGSHELVDVDFYDDYIIVEAPTRPGADTTDDYQYRYGRAERLGPEMIQPESTRTAEYDGTKVDWAVIPKVVADAERRAKIASPTSLHVSVMQSLDPKFGHPPTINVDVEGAYTNAFVTYSPAGKYLSEMGSAFTGE